MLKKQKKIKRRRFEVILASGTGKAAYYEHDVKRSSFDGEFTAPRWPKIFGYQSKDIKPKKDVEEWFKSKLHPDDRKKMESAYKHFFAGRGSYDLELRFRGRSGKWHWLRVINSALARDKKGRPSRVGGLIIDVSRRKRNEEFLHKERDKIRAIIENTQTQLAYFDNRFNFVDVNSAYVRDCRYKKEELLGKNHFAIFPDAENQKIFEKARDTGEKIEFKAKPFFYKNQPGRGITYWDWALTPVKDQSNAVVGLVLSLLNVTERVKTEQELEKYAHDAEQKSAEDEALLSSIGDGVIAVNNEKKIVFANQTFFDIFKTSQKRIINKKYHEVIPTCNKFGNPLSYDERPITLCFLQGKSVSKDYLDDSGYYAKIGETLVPLAITASPIVLEGKTIGVIGVCRDTTKEMQIDRSKNEFLSMAAHQLRTPLTTMRLTLEMILKGSLGKKTKKSGIIWLTFLKTVK